MELCEAPLQLKLQNVSESRLLKLQVASSRQSPILSIFKLIQHHPIPIQQGKSPSIQALIKHSSNNLSSANILQFTIWSICKWIMLNQLVSLMWQHLDVKWMDGVVKRRHRKYASLYSLLNFTACSMTSSVTGHLNKFIRTLSLAFCQTRFRRERTQYVIIHST